LDVGKDGASNYFIVVALVIEKDRVAELAALAEVIRKRHFQTGEIKSSNIKDKDGHARRIRVLDDVLALDFKFYALAVDKAKVRRDSGLQYKASFLKFLNGKLYNRLYRAYTEVSAICDEHGGESFKSSFRVYIEKNHKPDLFYLSDFTQVNSADNVLVQVADLIVGTIAKIYEGKSNPALNEKYLEMLKEKSLCMDEWPTKFQVYSPPDDGSDSLNEFIYLHSLSKAEVFLEDKEGSADEDTQMQVCALRKLVFQCRWGGGNYITAPEIIHHLRQNGHEKASEQYFRTSIIARLRDSGVIIASCNKGYKIPTGFSDFNDYVERVDSLVVPYLSRLKHARKSFLIASGNEVDLLKGTNYPTLVNLLEQISDN
jgi:hypothetical protein